MEMCSLDGEFLVIGLFEALLAAGSTSGGLAVDQVFKATLYTGTGGSRTITGGVNLTGLGVNPLGTGGLVWIKERSFVTENRLFDTLRGAASYLDTATTDGAAAGSTTLTAFGSAGFNLGSSNTTNQSGATYVAWSFRRAARFFDCVTWTGNGATNRTIPHSLGTVPGLIIVKCTSSGSTVWAVHHRSYSLPLRLDTTDAGTASGTIGGTSMHTDTGFLVLPSSGSGAHVNQSGSSYVAYLFAHDDSAGGIVQCGSYTGNGSGTGPSATLGWEPQFLLVKRASGIGSWHLFDAARGLSVGGTEPSLKANSDDAETAVDYIAPTSTGFQIKSTSSEVNASGGTYIFMAIKAP